LDMVFSYVLEYRFSPQPPFFGQCQKGCSRKFDLKVRGNSPFEGYAHQHNPVAKEEVRIRKEVVEDTEVVEEDVRREEVDIDDEGTRRTP
jgi:hypothetical protein